MLYARLQYAYNICAKFRIDCLKTLGGVDHTNLLPHIEAQTQNCLSRKCRNFIKNYFLSCKKVNAHLQYA